MPGGGGIAVAQACGDRDANELLLEQPSFGLKQVGQRDKEPRQ